MPPRTFKEWYEENEDIADSTGSDFIPVDPIELHSITQAQPNDLVHDLNLSQVKVDLLGPRLQISEFYSTEDNRCYCNDIGSLMEAFERKHKLEEWRLFIDAPNFSLKAGLFHNGNV